MAARADGQFKHSTVQFKVKANEIHQKLKIKITLSLRKVATVFGAS